MEKYNKLKNYLVNIDKKQAVKNNLLTIILFALIIATIIYNPSFLSVGTIVRLIDRVSTTLLMALGMAIIMIVGGTDLSAGRISGFVGLVCASLLQESGLTNEVFVGLGYVPIILPFLLSMIIGAAISVINALIIIKFRLHPFITTLATGLLLYGFMGWYMSLGTNGNHNITVSGTEYWELINSGFLIGGHKVYYYTFVIFAIVAAMWIVWNKTTVGRNMYAVGCNREAANITGISILKTTIICFALAGILFGLTGFVNGAKSSNNANSDADLALDAIAACIIGGISFAGGVGKIRGVVFGVFLMNLIALSLRNGLGLTNDYYTNIVAGIIIIAAVAIDMRRNIDKR